MIMDEAGDTAEAEKMQKGEDSGRYHRIGRRRCQYNKGGVRRIQCSAGTEKMEKGGEIIAEGEDDAGTIKAE